MNPRIQAALARYPFTLDDAVTKATIKGCFVAAKAGRPRLHLATGDARAVWLRGAGRPRLVAETACRRVLIKATSYIEPPDDIELCDLCAAADYAPWVVYRFFDSADVLLYIGSTEDFPARLTTHIAQTPFWPQVARWTFAPEFSQAAARAAEAAAIEAERPRFNVHHQLSAA